MYIAIAMAGGGTRFERAGFIKPKYELIVKGRPMFDWALESLSAFYKKADFVFIARTGAEEFIADRCNKLGIFSFQIVALNELTDGQATTVKIGIEKLDKLQSLMVYNIDTYISPDVIHAGDIIEEYDGWLLLFHAPGSHWSFVRMDDNGKVLEVSEKVRISDTASLGLYYFKSISLFEEVYKNFSKQVKEGFGEVYVMPLYKALIENNKMIGTKIISKENVVILGTPEEVEEFDPDFLKHNICWNK